MSPILSTVLSWEKMGKGCKVVVCGLLSVGKTAILEQLLYGTHTVGKILSFFLDSEAGGRCLWLMLTGVKEHTGEGIGVLWPSAGLAECSIHARNKW